MKLTRQQLTTIIKEELQAVLGEQEETPEEAGLDPEEEKKRQDLEDLKRDIDADKVLQDLGIDKK